MKTRLLYLGLALMVLGSGARTAAGEEAPPAPPTLWSFLGIPAASKIHAQLFNRHGNLPFLEMKPPLKAIADPANLKSDVPAIKAAAEIKQAEDLKKQKIKAIKYLSKIGCGCYDKDEKVTKALMAAMEDCTEEVRLEAVKAIADAGAGEMCAQCKQRSCCNQKIVDLLAKIAYERDEDGCCFERSERVRQAAARALKICCAGQGGPPAEPEPRAPEGPAPERRIEPGPEDAAPAPPRPDQPTPAQPATPSPSDRTTFHLEGSGTGNGAIAYRGSGSSASGAALVSSRRRFSPAMETVSDQTSSLQPISQEMPLRPVPQTRVPQRVTGTVSHVDLASGLAELHLHNNGTLPSGAAVEVSHRNLAGMTSTTTLEVLESRPGSAIARIQQWAGSPRITRGDAVAGWR